MRYIVYIINLVAKNIFKDFVLKFRLEKTLARYINFRIIKLNNLENKYTKNLIYFAPNFLNKSLILFFFIFILTIIDLISRIRRIAIFIKYVSGLQKTLFKGIEKAKKDKKLSVLYKKILIPFGKYCFCLSFFLPF